MIKAGRLCLGRTVTILKVDRMNLACDRLAIGVGDDVTTATFYPLACTRAGKCPLFRGFHALTVEHTGCRLHIASCREARGRGWLAIDFGQQAIIAPTVEMVTHDRDQGKVLRQGTPSAPSSGKLLDRIPDPEKLHLCGFPRRLRPCKNGRAIFHSTSVKPLGHRFILRVCCAWVNLVQAVMISAMFRNRTETQLAEFIQHNFDKTLCDWVKKKRVNWNPAVYLQ